MANTAIKVTSTSADEAIRQKLRSTTNSLLKQYFGQTLNTIPDITNIFMALMLKESHFNVNAQYATALDPYTSSGAADYYNSTVIRNMLTPGNLDDIPIVAIPISGNACPIAILIGFFLSSS